MKREEEQSRAACGFFAEPCRFVRAQRLSSYRVWRCHMVRGFAIKTGVRLSPGKVCRAATPVLLVLGLSASACLIFGKTEVKRSDRLLLIRSLAHEVAVARVPMPPGRKGIRLKQNGQLDQGQAKKELMNHGVSIKPGMPVEITAIRFKSNRIVFELNGGGKNGTHWYNHIEFGVGMETVPIGGAPLNAAQGATGSYLALALPSNSSNLTVDQVKGLLSSVLDFERKSPTVLYSPQYPPEIKKAIKNHQVIVGMDHDAVLSAKGPPDRKVREDKPDGSEEEDWIYGSPPHILYVVFDGDSVKSVKQY